MSDGILLSFPRSGNTWVRYCIEQMSGRPTEGQLGSQYTVKPYAICQGINKEELQHVDLTLNPIIKKLHRISSKDRYAGKLIVLVRNYKECLIRHSSDISVETYANDMNQLTNYFHVLEEYELWDNDKKILFYYHDIINPSNFRKFCKDLFKFLDLNEETCGDYRRDMIKNQAHHRMVSGKYYQDGQRSGGNKTIYHSKDMTDSQHKEWDRGFREHNPYLFDKYLSIYHH